MWCAVQIVNRRCDSGPTTQAVHTSVLTFVSMISESLTGRKSQTSTPTSNWRGKGFNLP
jgi:hypothetical protein